MNATPKHRATFYLALPIAVTLLTLTIGSPMKPFAANEVDAQTTARTTPPPRVKHNGKIVFTSDRHSTALSIWTMNPDGSSPTRLTDDNLRKVKPPLYSPVYDTNPVWSPDGTKIAFISSRDYLFSLYVMNADGTNPLRLTDKLEAGQPAWSADGAKIAFCAGMTGSFGLQKPTADIFVVNVNGGGLTQLTRDSGYNCSPNWSPDGKQIVFTSNRGAEDKAKIWVMNADGSNQREIRISGIENSSPMFDLHPVWSPDGTKILFTHLRVCTADTEIAIYVMDADGSNTRLLTNDPNRCGVYSSPKWSPDGTKIITSYNERSKGGDTRLPTQIIIMNADGSNPINISNLGQYRFSPAGATFTDVHADWQPLLKPLNSAPSVVGFSAATYSVNEEAGKADLTLTRTGNLSDVASCYYVSITEPPVQIKSIDGTVRFAAGQSTQTISIPFYNSNGALRTETYTIVLSDNEGNATFVGGIREATLTVVRRTVERSP